MPKKGYKTFQPAGVGMSPTKTELGKFVRERRLQLDMRQTTLNQLIPRSGPNNQLISTIEIGRRRFLDPERLAALAKALQVDPGELRKRMPVKHTAQPTTEWAKLIRSRREELGLSLSDFAKIMGLSEKQTKGLEASKALTIRYTLIHSLANALSLDLSVLAPFVGRHEKETGSELGKLIRLRRKTLGISSTELARKLGVSRQLVSQIELGQSPLNKGDRMLKKIAQVLELEVSELQAVRSKKKLKQPHTTNPLGRFLAKNRLIRGLTQQEVAIRAEVSSGAVCRVELGRLRPSLHLLDKLANVLEVQIPVELVPVALQRGTGIE